MTGTVPTHANSPFRLGLAEQNGADDPHHTEIAPVAGKPVPVSWTWLPTVPLDAEAEKEGVTWREAVALPAAREAALAVRT